MTEQMIRGKQQETKVTVDPRLGLGVGWFKQDGERNETVLAWNGSRDLCAVVSGEHFPETAEPESTDPASYLLRGYEREGAKFLSRLNGWFSGVVIDFRQDKIILFNDRYGLGRVYFHQNSDGFFFASQAKALLQIVPDLRRIDPQGLGEWISCGCVLQNRTLFSNVFLLPASSAWVFSADGSVVKGNYFDAAEWEAQPRLSDEEYYERLRETFPRILQRYLRENQPIGMSLTGGLDGRMIMAWSSKAPGELPCYTFNGPVRDCADARIARLVARACGQPHRTIQVESEFLAAFPKLAEETVCITDGALDVSGAAELYANRRAREISPIRLTGNYGSEILRTNVAFGPRRLSDGVFNSDFEGYVQRAASTFAGEVVGDRRSFITFKQIPWHHFGRFALEESQIGVRSPFLDNDLAALAFQTPAGKESDPTPAARLVLDGKPELGRIPNDRGVTYSPGKPPNVIRRSVEEFLAKAEYAYDYGMPQWLARIDRALEPLRLERLFLGRQKFCHFRTWYRHQLGDYVKQILLDPRSRSRAYVNEPGLERMVNSHVNGLGNYTMEIHKLLSLELLHRTLLDGSGA